MMSSLAGEAGSRGVNRGCSSQSALFDAPAALKRGKNGPWIHPSVSRRGRNNGPSVHHTEPEGRRIRDRIFLQPSSNWSVSPASSVSGHTSSTSVRLDKKCPQKCFSFYFNCPIVHHTLPKNDLVNADFSLISSNGLSRNLMVFPLVRCSLIELKTT